MSKYKICVYAICKNEEKFVKRWYESMSEADEIYVLDTGSTDASVKLLTDMGAHVLQETIIPWRFDVARNRSLEMVPLDTDLCVCTDIDEVFHPGWRKGMESALDCGASRIRYRYTWNFLPNGKEGCVFWIDKAHVRNDFIWKNPVHEVLYCTGNGEYTTVEAYGVQLDHMADPEKSRSQYLPLLELAVEENPEDDRNVHYLGREYMFHKMWPECEKMLKHHLEMPGSTWADERCASMRYLSRATLMQGKTEEAQSWLLKAIAEAPHLREPWLDAAAFALDEKNWCGALYFAEKALSILKRGRTYINEAESWGSKPYDIAAVAAFYLGLHSTALRYGQMALDMSPEDGRLKENLNFYRAAADHL